MMDILMILILGISFFAMKLLADWCEMQIRTTQIKEEKE